MTRFTLALGFVAAFLAGGLLMNGLTVQADDKKADEPKPRGQLYAKWKELGLSKDQVTMIYKIQSEHRGQIDKLEAQIKKLRAEERAEAEKVLTPAQKARLKEILSGEVVKEKTAPKDKPSVKPADKPANKDK
jgi:Spy/CpxP family protein refolding chaperone